MSPTRKTAVLCSAAFIVAMCIFCFFTGAELYPFAPFNMYSHPFRLPREDIRIEADLATSGIVTTFTVIGIGFVYENVISRLMSIPESEGTKENIQVYLRDLFKKCRAENCFVGIQTPRSSQTRAVPIDQIREIRVIRYVWRLNSERELVKQVGELTFRDFNARELPR